MRTTIDLDDSLLQRLRDEAHRQGVSFRALLHRVIQRGLEQPRSQRETVYTVPVHSLGQVREGVDLSRSIRLAAAIEDEHVGREMLERR